MTTEMIDKVFDDLSGEECSKPTCEINNLKYVRNRLLIINNISKDILSVSEEYPDAFKGPLNYTLAFSAIRSFTDEAFDVIEGRKDGIVDIENHNMDTAEDVKEN